MAQTQTPPRATTKSLPQVEITEDDKAEEGRNANARKAQAGAPEKIYVLDTTCTPERITNDGSRHYAGKRKHELVIKGKIHEFVFEYGVPLALPFETAAKFLRHEGFIRTDEDGTPLRWRNPPMQLEDMGPGQGRQWERDEVIARLDELTLEALRLRCAHLPGGEEVCAHHERDKMIQFILATKEKARERNSVRESDVELVDLDEGAADFIDDETTNGFDPAFQ